MQIPACYRFIDFAVPLFIFLILSMLNGCCVYEDKDCEKNSWECSNSPAPSIDEIDEYNLMLYSDFDDEVQIIYTIKKVESPHFIEWLLLCEIEDKETAEYATKKINAFSGYPLRVASTLAVNVKYMDKTKLYYPKYAKISIKLSDFQ